MTSGSAVDDPKERVVFFRRKESSGKGSWKSTISWERGVSEGRAVFKDVTGFATTVTDASVAVISVATVVVVAVAAVTVVTVTAVIVVAVEGVIVVAVATVDVVAVAAVRTNRVVTINRSGKGGELISEEADEVGLRVVGRKSCSRTRGGFGLGGFELEMNAVVEDHCLNFCACGSAWVDILRPDGVNRKSLELDDIRECRKVGRTTCGSEVSDSSLNACPVRRERFIFSLRTREAIRMCADVAAALKLVLEVNRVPHFSAESKAADVALKKKRPIRRFVGPFVEKISEASLTVCVAFGRSGRSSCSGRGTGRGRRRSRGCRESRRPKKVEAEMRFCLKKKNLGPNIKATGSGAGKRWDNTRRR